MKETIDTSSMIWGDINGVNRYTANKTDNKAKRTKHASKILLGAIQYAENYLRSLKQLNAYDASSIIKSDSSWLQKHSFNEFKVGDRNVAIKPGQICYLDYGKAYKGELAYFHYGLCVSRKDGKLFVIPITSATSWINDCYHPVKNPSATKKYRQGLKSEGFSKDCVLMLNDAKFISAGRIDSLDVEINPDTLVEIQQQLFTVCFPNINSKFITITDKIDRLDKKIKDKDEIITGLKNSNTTLNQKLLKYEKSTK